MQILVVAMLRKMAMSVVEWEEASLSALCYHDGSVEIQIVGRE
jgi:hypothetical protein